MKKDVNLILFGLVIFLLISVVGITLYYQETYKSLDASHRAAMDRIIETEVKLNESIREVELKSRALNEREQELVDIINELNISRQQISSLSGYYDSLKGQKETLEDALGKAEGEVDSCNLKLSDRNQEIEICKKDKNILSDNLITANSRISKARGKVTENMSRLMTTLDIDFNEMKKLLKDDKIYYYMEDVEDDLESCNCTAGRMDELRETVEDLDSLVTASNNVLFRVNAIVNKLKNILVTA